MHQILIDSEFKALIPQLSSDERSQLEANLLADGCRDPLVVWAEQGILIDGHNRHEICTRHGIAFDVIYKNFDSRDDAVEWIIKNQFGRRNLSDYQRGLLALLLKPIFEARAKARQHEGVNQYSLSPKSDEASPIRTDVAVAEAANLGKDTIRKIERIEGKHAGSMLQTGQRLALERLVDACHNMPRRIAVALIVDHDVAPDVDVDFATCTVRAMRWRRKWVHPMQTGISCRQAIDRRKNMQRQHLTVLKGGAA